ncbi:hypothetical protein B4O97_18230 [Marispirochaeta aestuarii]|uniref:DUF4386 domain-containing protein n=1 Tax=Marispirochaeta aestuarii TaxID=1963862 RepID=A0A1Y1RT97_9SPIO|nr:hypothetical protein B4O97_18230 [Marispirochaeta aestuarii]
MRLRLSSAAFPHPPLPMEERRLPDRPVFEDLSFEKHIRSEIVENTGSLRRYGIIAGVGYILLFVLAIFANFVVREGLIVAADAAQTAVNIRGSEGLFRTGIVSFMLVFLIDVPVAWALYVLFSPVNRNLSLLSAWFRIVYTVFLGVALIFFFQALQLYSNAEFLRVFTEEQLNAQALTALNLFNSTWLIGLLAFGVHLVIAGVLLIKSRWTVPLLGYIVMISGITYVIDTAAHSLLANYADYAMVLLVIVAVPSILAEGWFGLWLLIKGGKNIQAMPE